LGKTDPANVSSALAQGNVVQLTPGTYYGSMPVTMSLGNYVMGAGKDVTVWNNVGGTTAFVIENTGAYSTTQFAGLGYMTINGSGTTSASALGLQAGDIVQLYFPELAVESFPNAKPGGVYFYNQMYWTEQLHGSLYVTDPVVFDYVAPGTNSFDRMDLTIWIAQSNTVSTPAFAVQFLNGAYCLHGSLAIRGNLNPGSSGLLQITGDGGLDRSSLVIGVESDGTSGNPQTINFAGGEIKNCYGSISFAGFGGVTWAPSNNAGNLQSFNGPVTGDTTLSDPWISQKTGFPTGWSGVVDYRMLPTGDQVMISWALVIASGTAISTNETLFTLPASWYYSDSKILPAAINGGGLTGYQFAPAVIRSDGTFRYGGPAATASGTAWWYGQGIYTLDVS